MPHDPDEPIELYRARGGTEAQELCGHLEEAGIGARVDNDLLSGVVGEVPAGWVTSPRILVRAEQFDAAQEILEWFLEDAEDARTHDDGQVRCLACGELMGEAEKCPDCGWTFQTAAEDE